MGKLHDVAAAASLDFLQKCMKRLTASRRMLEQSSGAEAAAAAKDETEKEEEWESSI